VAVIQNKLNPASPVRPVFRQATSAPQCSSPETDRVRRFASRARRSGRWMSLASPTG
jgi:hypothetical protein